MLTHHARLHVHCSKSLKRTSFPHNVQSATGVSHPPLVRSLSRNEADVSRCCLPNPALWQRHHWRCSVLYSDRRDPAGPVAKAGGPARFCRRKPCTVKRLDLLEPLCLNVRCVFNCLEAWILIAVIFLEPFCALSNICFRKLWQWSLRCFPFSIWPNVVPHQRACCQWVAILCGFDVVEFRAQWNLLFWVASKSTALAGQHMTGYPSATIEWIWKHDGWEKVLYQWNFSDSISASPTSVEPKPWPWRQDILQDKCIGYVNQALKTFMELSCNSFAFELVVNTFCSASSFFGCQSDPDSKFLLHQVSFVEETLSPRLFHV